MHIERLASIAIRTDVERYDTSLVRMFSKVGIIHALVSKAHITHQTTAKDISTVNAIDCDLSSTHRSIEAASKYTTEECLTADGYICNTSDRTGISTANNVHHRLT